MLLTNILNQQLNNAHQIPVSYKSFALSSRLSSWIGYNIINVHVSTSFSKMQRNQSESFSPCLFFLLIVTSFNLIVYSARRWNFSSFASAFVQPRHSRQETITCQLVPLISRPLGAPSKRPNHHFSMCTLQFSRSFELFQRAQLSERCRDEELTSRNEHRIGAPHRDSFLFLLVPSSFLLQFHSFSLHMSN